MKKIKLFAIIMAATLIFTGLPISVHAATPKKPAKVTGVAKKAVGTNYITVKWTRIKNNKNTKGYVVYRYTSGAWKSIKRVGKNTLEYKNTGLKANTNYKYRVRAYNSYKQKQYYNSRTKKWQVKKPAKKYWKACKTGAYKGKKTRSVTKYLYGPLSSIVTIKTAQIKKTGDGYGKNEDALFKNSSMSDKTLYIDKDYRGSPDLVFELSTSGEDADSIKWVSSDTKVVEVQRAVMIGASARLAIKGTGTATITATNWDGQKKTATVTVKSVNDNQGGSGQETEEEKEGGVVLSTGTVYPSEDGVFDIKRGTNEDFKIGNVDVAMASLPFKFPNGSTFRINASEVVWETNYYFEGKLQTGVHSQNGYSPGFVSINSISDKSMIINMPYPYCMDANSGGIFFLNKGTCRVEYSNGVVHTFIISGKNIQMSNYREYVKDVVDANKNKNSKEKALAVIKEVYSIPYGFTSDPLAMVTSNAGGNCTAKTALARRLMSELGVECYVHLAFRNKVRHEVLEVILDGRTYIADPTNREDLLSWEEYESLTGRKIEYNRDSYAYHTSIIY